MSERIKSNKSQLWVLASPDTRKEVYSAIVRYSSRALVKAIAEIFQNIGYLRFPLPDEALHFLSQFPKAVEALGQLKANRAGRALLIRSYHIVKVGLHAALDYLQHHRHEEEEGQRQQASAGMSGEDLLPV
jgi:hypothetical protein